MHTPDNWYSLGSQKRRHRFVEAVVIDNVINDDKLFYGEYSENTAVRLKVARGTKWGDYILCDSLAITCISQKTVDCLVSNNITGYRIYPLVIVDKKDVEIMGYFGLSVLGRIGQLLDDKSYIEEQEPIVPGGSKIEVKKGMRLDLTSWSGDDICTIPGTYYIFINQKVVDIFRENDISAFGITQVEEMEHYLF